MTSKMNSAVIAFLLAAAGAALFFIRYVPLGITPRDVIIFAMIIIGFVSAFFSFGGTRKAALFVSSVMFLTGAAFFTVGQMDIISRQQITFPAVLMITGLSFFMLYLDGSKNKAFLIAGLFLILSGTASVYFRKSLAFVSFANDLGYNLMQFWPVYILIVGTVYLLRKKV